MLNAVRLRIDLAYDGTGFYGWAKQPEIRTVQGEIERVLHTIFAYRKRMEMCVGRGMVNVD